MEELLGNIGTEQLWRYVWLLVIIWLIVVWMLYVARRQSQRHQPGAGDATKSTEKMKQDSQEAGND